MGEGVSQISAKLRRRRSVIMAAASAVSLACVSDAFAVTIRDDVADSDYTALSAETPYTASGYLITRTGEFSSSLASATLIAPNWIITAAHAVSQDAAGYPT